MFLSAPFILNQSMQLSLFPFPSILTLFLLSLSLYLSGFISVYRSRPNLADAGADLMTQLRLILNNYR